MLEESCISELLKAFCNQENNVTLYHGSNKPIVNPDIEKSSPDGELGQGFYLTTSKFSAECWAIGKFKSAGGNPTVSIYQMHIGEPIKNKYIALAIHDEYDYAKFIRVVKEESPSKLVYYDAVWCAFSIMNFTRALEDILDANSLEEANEIIKSYYKFEDDQICLNEKLIEILEFKESYTVSF